MSVINKTIIAQINKAFEAETSGIAAIVAKTDAAIQKAVDAMLVSCKVSKKEFMKGNAKTNEARAEVAGLFNGLAAAGHFSESSARQYATCFWIAFETGQPFTRTAVNKKSAAKNGARAPSTPTTVSIGSLAAQIAKCIKMARMLESADDDMVGLAADLLDVAENYIDYDFEGEAQ